MMNKTEFLKVAIKTSKRDYGKTALNKVYNKRNKKQFVRDFIISLWGFSTISREKSYGEEYDNDAILIEEAGGYYEHVIVEKVATENKQRVREGYFVKMYTDEVTYTCKGYEVKEEVLVVVPKAPFF